MALLRVTDLEPNRNKFESANLPVTFKYFFFSFL